MNTPTSPTVTRTVTCPTCQAPVAWTPASRFRPFCSARCKGMDLGAWASEQYRVAAVDVPDDSESLGDDAAD